MNVCQHKYNINEQRKNISNDQMYKQIKKNKKTEIQSRWQEKINMKKKMWRKKKDEKREYIDNKKDGES